MPTPSTRTPVRIARGSYSNLNSSISDLQDGEISYAEDQDKLYIKEGTSLVALTYTPASPAFTGTITGVNLTLSGNLTVSGTQTIINTSVLDVEDINITLGKVSTPSDTTANNGGITLKGSTDKTFNWLNATDAWTSSEHIHLGDNKQLIFGDSSDFIIKHNGSDILLRNVTGTGNLRLEPKNGELGVLCQPDAGTSLYHDNVKTFETFDNGVVVYGPEGGAGDIYLYADEGDDNADRWKLEADTSGNFKVGNKSTGSWVNGLTLDGSNNATFAGTVSDSKGDLRKIIKNTKASAYVAVASDAGKCIFISSGGVTINNNVFSDGEAVTIVNNSTSDQTITQGSGLTMHNAADASSGNRVLAGRGMATIWFHIAAECYISGAGLS